MPGYVRPRVATTHGGSAAGPEASGALVEQPRGNAAARASLGTSVSMGLGATLETLAGLTGVASSEPDVETRAAARAQTEALIQRIQAQTDRLQPRLVEADGGYLYRQFPDRVEIVDGPGRGTEVKAGTRAYDAIVGEIGPHPAVSGEEGGGRVAEAPPEARKAAAGPAQEQAWWNPGSWGAVGGIADLTGKALVGTAEAELDAWAGSSGGRDRPIGRGPEQDLESEPVSTVLPQKERHYDDSVKGRRQARLDALLADYQNIEVTVLVGGQPQTFTVRARYRIASDETELDANPVYWGDAYDPQTPFVVAKYHHEKKGRGAGYGMARAGKASPKQLGEALEEESVKEPLATRLANAAGPAAAREIIQEHAYRSLGVDCSGFVWRALQSVDESAYYANDFGQEGVVAGIDNSRYSSAKSGADLREDGVDLTGQPASWTTGDVIQEEGSGGDGHIVIIYDCVHDPGTGTCDLEIMESAGGDGVRRMLWTYDPRLKKPWRLRSGGGTGMGAGTVVTRPKPFAERAG